MQTDVQHIAISHQGAVAIGQFVTKRYRKGAVVLEREPSDENIEAWLAAMRRDYTSWRRIAPNDVPADRAFRDAWTDDGAALSIDMPKARDIQRDRIRRARAPLLAALDAQYLRADEAGDTAAKADIARRKQALRDLPARPEIDSAATPDDLKAFWPDELGRLA